MSRRTKRKKAVKPIEEEDERLPIEFELMEVERPWEVTPFMLKEKARLIALEERSHNYGYNPATGKVERMRPTFDY